MTDGYKYANIVLSLMPRIISSLDRSQSSSTCGCFDKAYWFYKTSDFPCARYQEPSLTFALLFKNRFKGNIFFKRKNARRWAEAGVNFLARIQNKDGSFNEWYPNEHSFVATAFSTYKASETIRVLGNDFHVSDEAIACLKRSARWLSRQTDDQPSNQIAGAVAAIYNIYMLTGDEAFRKRAERQLGKIRHSPEGWMTEYGGADIGYLTVAIDFLAKYWKESKDEEAHRILIKALEFLKYFIHPDGSLGGVYGSRNTEFKLPHGIEIMSRHNNDALYIGSRIYDNIDNTLNPLMMDDRFALQYHTSYLQAFLDFNKDKQSKIKIEPSKFFPGAGLMVLSGKYYMVINTKKGGVFRIFNDKGHVYEDAGMIARTGRSSIMSQWNNSSEPDINGNKIRITGSFVEKPSTKHLTPVRNIMFRSMLATAGSSGRMAPKIKRKLRGRLIEKAVDAHIGYERTIELKSNSVIVTDKILNPKGKQLERLIITSDIKPSYVPTSSFSNMNAIDSNTDMDYTEEFRKNQAIKRVIKL
jgi:hypothetical protein